MLRTTGLYSTTLSPGSRTGFQNPNPPTVPNGSQVNAAWLNDVQENVCGVIESTGITLEDSDSNGGAGQLQQAVRRLTGSNYGLIIASMSPVTLTPDSAGRIVVNAAAGNIVITLPLSASMAGTLCGSAVSNSIAFKIFRDDNSSNTVTIQTAGSDNIGFAGLTGTSFLIPPLATAELFSDTNITWLMTVPPVSGGPPQMISYLTPGTNTFVVPAGKTMIRATLTGAPGGGGGTHTTGDAGVAGAGAPEAVFMLAVQPGWSLTVVVGASGTGGTGGASPTAGGAGGTTSIAHGASTLAAISGGTGGAASNSAGIANTGNIAGLVTTGTPVLTRAAAAGGFAYAAGSALINAQGGAPDGVSPSTIITATGATPLLPGCGGYGGCGGGGGGAGGPARVVLEY
jgi:hypothetical protein